MRLRRLLKKILISLLVIFLIYPVSPLLCKAFFEIKEPYFKIPIIQQGGDIKIRKDSMGEGSFGARRSSGRRTHKGLDLEAAVGTPVYASKSGMAVTGNVPKGMGQYVKITHPVNGYTTIYGHLSSVDIKNKRWVWQGEVIGKVGKTGNANSRGIKAHLHFEIRKDNIHEDPLPFLAGQKMKK